MIDQSVPRECVYRRFRGHPGPCPRCGGPLQREYAHLLVVTRRDKKPTGGLMIGNDECWFCPRCPTVVINPEQISEMLLSAGLGKPDWNVGSEFAVAGIVDLDAVPPDKYHQRLGGDDNPIPLVEFTAISDETVSPRTPSRLKPLARDYVPEGDEDRVENRYLDILQNIEMGIIQVYREHPEMTDWDVLRAVEALLRTYQAEAKGRRPVAPSLTPLVQEVYASVQVMCDWRLGREQLYKDEQPVDVGLKPVTVDVIVACLKRIRKSINFWSKQSGRQGYLNYVNQFIP